MTASYSALGFAKYGHVRKLNSTQIMTKANSKQQTIRNHSNHIYINAIHMLSSRHLTFRVKTRCTKLRIASRDVTGNLAQNLTDHSRHLIGPFALCFMMYRHRF
jgi:hypothetical protein